jgi:hypothetical protein
VILVRRVVVVPAEPRGSLTSRQPERRDHPPEHRRRQPLLLLKVRLDIRDLRNEALAGRVSTALSVVTELNFPLNGTMTAASACHKPITSHGTHRPANRPGGAFLGGAALTDINSLLTGCIACLRPTSYRANLRRPLIW